MIITLTPDDLLRRCLWADYRKFALRDKNEDEIEIIVKENKPISIAEDLGYVIGLLKVIETDNLVHRFGTHMDDVLKIKSTIHEKNVFVSVKIIENELSSFKKRFPIYWKPELNYEKAIKDLIVYIEKLEDEIKKFEIFEFKIKDKKIRYFQSREIKRLLDNNE